MDITFSFLVGDIFQIGCEFYSATKVVLQVNVRVHRGDCTVYKGLLGTPVEALDIGNMCI